MAAMAASGALLSLILALWMIAWGLDHTLSKIFGRKPQPQPRRHRAF